MTIHHGVFASMGDEININWSELAKCGRRSEVTFEGSLQLKVTKRSEGIQK